MSATVWYKHYPSDFLHGVARMTAEERGIYASLLDMMYAQGGSIPYVKKARPDRPGSPARLASACGSNTRRFNIILERLLEDRKLIHKHGRLFNKRVFKELKHDFISTLSLHYLEIIFPELFKFKRLTGPKKPDSRIHNPDRHNADAPNQIYPLSNCRGFRRCADCGGHRIGGCVMGGKTNMLSRTKQSADAGPRSNNGANFCTSSRRGCRENSVNSSEPSRRKQPGQHWPVRRDGTHRPRCYKCEHWRSNMPMTGRCDIRAKPGLLSSHDTMPGDGCARFEVRRFTTNVIPASAPGSLSANGAKT